MRASPSRTRPAAALAFLALAAGLLAGGCAPVQTRPDAKAAEYTLVYPPPPDEPRFYYERTLYSTANFVPDEEAGLRAMLTGEQRRGIGFSKPYAVAVHQGRVFVSDSVDSFVKVLDIPNGKYFTIGEQDPGQIMKPLGLDVDGDGNLYVADNVDKSIKIYNRDGKFLRRIPGDKLFDRLSSVTVDRAGTRVFAVDIGGVNSERHQVRVFDAKTGAHLFDFGKRGTGPGEFNLPRDVAIGKDGKVYVVDGGNFRIQVFDRDGKFLNTFGAVGKQLGTFARPKEITTDREGNVYVIDTAFGNFQIFDPEGQLLMFVGDRAERDGPGRYMLPSGIYVDEDGRVYVVDQWFRKVDVFRPAKLPEGAGHLVYRPPGRAAK